MKKLRVLLFLFVAVFSLCSCVTTSTYGKTFQPISEGSDIHFLKIYYGGPPPEYASNKDFQQGTSSALFKYSKQFMENNPHYTSYEVLDIEQNRIPSYFKYKVKFIKEEDTNK